MAALLFARPIASHFTTAYVGRGVDQPFFIWCLVWWPYALTHHLNPFVSKLIFAPAGLNLTWTTPIPLLSLLAFPLTKTLGPIATYNLLCVICPALAAWTAFLLCRHLTRELWPSLLGGYLFGFSSYVLGHVLGGHPDCFCIFIVPLMVRVVLARLEGRVTRWSFAGLFLALLVAQFLIADELVATLTVVGAAALIAGWIFGDGNIRRGLEGLVVPILFAYLGTAALMSPWLYYVSLDFLHRPLRAPQEYSIDLLNLVIPTQISGLSYLYAYRDLWIRFTGNITEQSGYIGVPLLILVVWFALTRRRTFAGKLLTVMIGLTAVIAMGPRLHVAGIASLALPWRVIRHMPLLNQALPGRVFLYTTLLLAIVAAMWFSSARVQPWTRVTIAAILMLSLVPNPSALWAHHANQKVIPSFFASGQYRRYLARDEIVVIPPSCWGAGSEAMLWQAQSGMYFRLATGYLPFAPAAIFEWPIVTALMQQIELPDAADQWIAFSASHQASLALVVDRVRPPGLNQMFEEIGASRFKVDGVTLYRMPAEKLAEYPDIDSTRMEALEQDRRFRQLLLAARTYVDSGADPVKITLDKAVKHGLHALEWKPWGMQPQESSVALYATDARQVAIGVTGTYAAVAPLIQRYSGFAQSLYFPFPHRLGQVALPRKHCPRPLVMVFDKSGLRRAAMMAEPIGQPSREKVVVSP